MCLKKQMNLSCSLFSFILLSLLAVLNCYCTCLLYLSYLFPFPNLVGDSHNMYTSCLNINFWALETDMKIRRHSDYADSRCSQLAKHTLLPILTQDQSASLPSSQSLTQQPAPRSRTTHDRNAQRAWAREAKKIRRW